MKLARSILKTIREQYTLIAVVFILTLIILIVYWQDLTILLNEALQSEAAGHIIFVPFLVSYLIYRKRDMIRASLRVEGLSENRRFVSVSDFVGIAFCLTAFLLYWYGSYTFYPLEYHVASLVVFTAGITLVLTDLRVVRTLIFPIAFVAFVMPPPSPIIYSVGGVLASINTQGSYALLKTAGLPVSLSYSYGAPIIALNTSTGPIEFGVYQASSGLYSLIAFTMFAAFLVYITRGSFVRRTGLFVLGLLFLPLINIVRISMIVSAAYWLGEEIAMNIFHTFAGWILIFGGMLFLLMIGEKVLRMQILGGPKKTLSCQECDLSLEKQDVFCMNCGKFLKTVRVSISKTFWVKLVALLISSYLLATSVQAPAFAFAPSLTLTNSEPEVNMTLFPNITGYKPLQFLYRDVSYERVAHQDASLVYAYLPQEGQTLPVYVIVGVANSISNLHNWEVSLIAWRTAQGLPPLVSTIDSGDRQLTENPRIIAHFLVFQHPSNFTYVALYWYQTALFKMGLTVEPRYIRINLLVLTRNPNDYTSILQDLDDIGRSIALYWEPLKVQSLVSLGIPLQQVLLGSTVIAAAFLQTSQYVLDQRKKRINLRIFEKLASPDEKRVYKVVKELGMKTKQVIVQNIASALDEGTDKKTNPSELIENLKNLEKNGLLKRDVISVYDEPLLVWKP